MQWFTNNIRLETQGGGGERLHCIISLGPIRGPGENDQVRAGSDPKGCSKTT